MPCRRPGSVGGSVTGIGLLEAAFVAVVIAGCTSSVGQTSVSSRSASAPPASAAPATSSPAAGAPSTSAAASSAPTGHPGPTSSTGVPATVRVTATQSGMPISLRKGQLLQVEIPSAISTSGQQLSYDVTPAGSTVLTAVSGTPGLFSALATGAAKVEVTERPVCVAGQACVAHIVVVGSAVVTVDP
jgi:hypothetical protein